MILGTVTKQPNESWPVAIEFNRRLAEDETLASASATATNLGDGTDASGTFLSLVQAFTTRAQVRLNVGGLDGERYRVQVSVLTNLGNLYEGEIDVQIREF